MKCLRIVLKQTSANYWKPECFENKMTYPLPPVSTVIGAFHNACGYSEYHPMDISIQGNFEGMRREPYTDHCFLNSTMDDRGILVRLNNSTLLSAGFTKVAVSKKQGSSFTKKKDIDIVNHELFEEYLGLKKVSAEIKTFKDTRFKKLKETINKRKKELAEKKKGLNKNSKEYKAVEKKEKYYKDCEKEFKKRLKVYEDENYNIPVSQYASLTTSIKYYEILDNINLVIHIKSNEDTLNDIYENINNLTAIGRSEDFVDVVSCDFTELTQDLKKPAIRKLRCKQAAYVNVEDVSEDAFNTHIKPRGTSEGGAKGTVYYMPKNYVIEDDKRAFAKKKVMYLSDFRVSSLVGNIWADCKNEDEQSYIVNFI
ncbi:MAG: CRISPR-associated protein Cas5 [Clostridiales bacterium]|nr:CRISPR-associated protein Cas5 [Clostridiales bacterium]